MSLLKSDLKRYPHQKDMPIFQKFMRKYQDSNNKILKVLYKILFVFFRYSNKVEIAPNSYVNCDVPSHSVVFGNPCVIKHKENATESYIENKVL